MKNNRFLNIPPVLDKLHIQIYQEMVKMPLCNGNECAF